MSQWILFIVIAVNLASCVGSSSQTDIDTSGPNSKAVLCEALGRSSQDEALCSYTTDRELRALLFSVFPKGTATETEVRTRLGKYLLETRLNPYGSVDTYAIEETLFSTAPVTADFSFDEDGILQEILIQDIL